MFRQTLAQIKNLSYVSPDPPRAERAMFNLITCSFKLCKRVLTKELLCGLKKRGVGTNEVEKCVKNLCKSSVRKSRDTKLVRFIMSRKVLDANIEERRVRREYMLCMTEFNNIIRTGSEADREFRTLMKTETEKLWRSGKTKNRNKADFLTKKYKPRKNREKRIRGVAYRDSDLEEMEKVRSSNTSNEPRMYGGVEIDREATSILNKDPNFMLLNRIDKTEIEVEIEKGLAKARYELMNNDSEEDEEGGSHERVAIDNTLNYAAMRATEIPTVARLCPPKSSTLKKEKVLESVKNKMLETVSDYQKQYCNVQGKIKKQNISKSEEKAIKDIKKKVKDKDIVVFTTDKSGRFAVDTPENYERAVMDHTVNDAQIGKERVRQIETKINQHMKQFNKMFRVGTEHAHEKRVEMATQSTNTPAPPLYGLRKDHKVTTDAERGPPVRPVCGANQAPNSRLSNFVSRIINDFADEAEMETECRSSEEMRAAFERYNDEDPEKKKKCTVMSMDVKALYPSMEWDEIITAVRELIENSEEEIKNADYEEIGKYLAVTMTREEIVKEGLSHVVPERKIETGREISVAYLCRKANEDKWKKARKPGKKQKKRMVALAVAKGVQTCMANHVYCVGDKVFVQLSGGPIGLELTGAVSRAFMWRWDKLYLERVRNAGMEMMMYERYVDDSNQVAVIPPPGSRYCVDQRKIVIDTNIDEHETPGDERMAKILLSIANSIMPCVVMEGDWPSKNGDKKMPILDMKVWTDQDGNVLYQHYEKNVSSKTVLHAKSAHSSACKRSVHTQEIVRRLMNTSHRLGWRNETAPVLTEYMLRMKRAGYSEKYRREVLTHALGIYDRKWAEQRNGTRPIFRPKGWKKKERREAKRSKKLNWATKDGHIAPIFVPTTPGGILAKMMRKVADEEAKEGIKFKVMEIGGRTLKSELQKSNPTASPGCGENDCIACIGESGEGGNCRRNNVNYEIQCHLCPEEDRPVYIGETSRNIYTRGKEHVSTGRSAGNREDDGNEEEDASFMHRHVEQFHQGMEADFRAKVTKQNKDSLSRQVREGVLIRRSTKKMLNSKSEWFQPPIYRIRSEIVRE